MNEDKPKLYNQIYPEDYDKNIEILNMFIKYITNENCSCDVIHIVDDYNDGCNIMAQQTLSIRFDLSDYTIIDELIEKYLLNIGIKHLLKVLIMMILLYLENIIILSSKTI